MSGAKEVREAKAQLAAARDHRAATREEFDGIAYCRFADDWHGIARGTVVVAGSVVPTYPHIGRILALRQGLASNFSAPVVAEEKLDGYNVRLVRVGRRLLAFTRGGYVCPFTADRIEDLGNFHPLFDARPDLVVCGEVVGPNNPYIDTAVPQVQNDVQFFVFDLMRLDTPGFVPLPDRDALLDTAPIRRAPSFGQVAPNEHAKIRRLVTDLDARGAEGIIFKPIGAGVRLKYVTPARNFEDIALDAGLLDELPGEFFTGRIERLVFSLAELTPRQSMDAWAGRLGHALLSGFRETLERVAQGGTVRKRFCVHMHSHAAADQLLRHLARASSKIQIIERTREENAGWVTLTFDKTFQESTSRLSSYLGGQYVID